MDHTFSLKLYEFTSFSVDFSFDKCLFKLLINRNV